MTTFVLAKSAFVPIAVGFFGLGTGYLIYAPQELFGFPARNRGVDLASGIWGFWMPGFMQFFAGLFLFVGLAWLGSFNTPALYMTALAFTAFGVHWWALGLNRAFGGDARLNGFMSIAFIVLSALGIFVFFTVSDWPVGLLFIGLLLVYISEFFVSLFPAAPPREVRAMPAGEAVRRVGLSERVLGLVRLATGVWLMYLTWAATVNLALGYKWAL
jgi:hypothetical protein